jgi:excisionase family DNA binding protein
MNDQRVGLADLRKDRPIMTVIEVAEFLRVHRITIYRAVKAGDKLGQMKIGRVLRFNREDVVRFADGGSSTA